MSTDHDVGPLSAVVLEEGTRLDDFVIEKSIGVGGMSRVYRARQLSLDRPVALKIMSPELAGDQEFAARFRREGRITRYLEHPAVLPVYAAGEAGGRLYLATRLVAGRSLAQVMTGTHTETVWAISVLRAIASALDHAHAHGVIHRDVKPANVMLDADGRPFLCDFGICKQVGVDLTSADHRPGTQRYMAPEQLAGAPIGHRADVYALACVAAEMLSRPPVGSAVPDASQSSVPARSRGYGLPRVVTAVLDRGTAQRPGDRHPSAGAFVDALEAATARRPWRSALVGAGPGPRRRRTLAAAGLAVAAVAVVAATGLTGVDEPPLAVAPAAGSSRAPAELAAVPRGDLLYAAALNGTSEGFLVSPSTQPSSAREAVRYLPGALELEAVLPQGETYSEFDLDNGVKTFLGEIDFSTRPGSDVELCWSLRWAVPRQLANFLCVRTATGETAFSVFRRGQGKVAIGEPIVLPDVPAGRTVRLAAVVRERQLWLYADSRLVLDVPNDQVPVAGTSPGLEMESTTGTGLVRITRLSMHALDTGN